MGTTKCKLFLLLGFLAFSIGTAWAQNAIKGTVIDEVTGEGLISAFVMLKDDPSVGASTDFDGYFELPTDAELPLTVTVSYIGYEDLDVLVTSWDDDLTISMSESSVIVEGVEIVGQRVSDRQKSAPLTVESLDLISIKETPAENFYDGLGALKDVDLTAASLGFKIINTRGFNSTSPVRTLQLIDGVDNQSPGLNFSLGNFLGSSELDVLKVDIIQGASTAFYGPNAFNGVINMQTKDPFFHKGLAGRVKAGERNLLAADLRYANSLVNKNNLEWMAFKVNLSYMTADDWEATNYSAVDGTPDSPNNPGGYDAVNRYGDESGNLPGNTVSPSSRPGFGTVYQTGYNEIDLVDYGTENIKASGALHVRLQPSKTYESTELIAASNFGGGTTVYQGDNRFSLRNIRFFQHRLELRKKDKFFWRVYMTHEDAGDSYDPYFTALQLQDRQKPTDFWLNDYKGAFQHELIAAQDSFVDPLEDFEGYEQFLSDSADLVQELHDIARENADSESLFFGGRLIPGTAEFQEAFDDITGRIANSEGGTRFFDRSALIHTQGEYDFDPIELASSDLLNTISFKTGASGRLYMPNSRGSILLDTMGRNIDAWEFGVYGGLELFMWDRRLKFNATARFDQHENFSSNFSPAASLVYTPSQNSFWRVSYSSAIRNPTLSDQFLNYNVGRAILRGNLDGVENLVTLESLGDYLNTLNRDTLMYFDVPPIETEKVQTIEVGYRTTLFDALYVDASYYYSRYRDFIGFELGADVKINSLNQPTDVDVYRVSANARDIVTTQGFSVGMSYYFSKFYQLRGNYSWNRLNTNTDDPIIPAFNTPEHKFNIGLSGRDVPIRLGGLRLDHFGFNVNYKWIEGFVFEGSPQFTGFIPTYDIVDAQINYFFKEVHTTLKIGATNLLDNRSFQTYGGPEIGRLAYISLTYDWLKK